jgi:hypothetical protein
MTEIKERRENLSKNKGRFLSVVSVVSAVSVLSGIPGESRTLPTFIEEPLGN